MALGDVMSGEHRPQLVEAVVRDAAWGMGEVQRWRATPKTQNYLSCDSALSRVMTSESCASRGYSRGKTFGKQRTGYRCPRAFVKATKLRGRSGRRRVFSELPL
jgi:hypothetical protein